jgi:hypothetical protein
MLELNLTKVTQEKQEAQIFDRKLELQLRSRKDMVHIQILGSDGGDNTF